LRAAHPFRASQVAGEDNSLLVVRHVARLLQWLAELLSPWQTLREPRDTRRTVSQQNVEMLHEAVDAYGRGDVEAFLEAAHPDVEWYPFTAQAEGGGAYQGHEGVRRWWSNLVSNLDEFEVNVNEWRDLGDTVIAFGELRGQFKSGVALEQEVALVARYRDGLLVWGRAYRTRAEALEAVGLRE
jgi:ketosteroid isomerase-like protein